MNVDLARRFSGFNALLKLAETGLISVMRVEKAINFLESAATSLLGLLLGLLYFPRTFSSITLPLMSSRSTLGFFCLTLSPSFPPISPRSFYKIPLNLSLEHFYCHSLPRTLVVLLRLISPWWRGSYVHMTEHESCRSCSSLCTLIRKVQVGNCQGVYKACK